MTMPSQTDRRTFWTHAYARSAFIEARLFAERLCSLRLAANDLLRDAFTTAIVVAYSRPFKQHLAVRLLANIVPPGFSDTHDSIIEMRDKVIAHRDLNGPATDWGFISQLQINVSSGTFTIETLASIMSDDKAREVILLTSALIQLMDAGIDAFVNRYMIPFDPTEAHYVVSLEPQPQSWLVRL